MSSKKVVQGSVALQHLLPDPREHMCFVCIQKCTAFLPGVWEVCILAVPCLTSQQSARWVSGRVCDTALSKK